MAVNTGKTGQGAKFQISDGATVPTWLTIANVTSINPTGIQADEIDFTHLLSTGGYREFRQGFKDGGTINIDYSFDATAASHVGTGGLIGLFNSGTVFTWRINFFGVGWSFALEGTGYVQNPGDLTIAVDSPIAGSATVRVTGMTTLVAVTA